jgi:hypothetical protein
MSEAAETHEPLDLFGLDATSTLVTEIPCKVKVRNRSVLQSEAVVVTVDRER